MAIVLIVLVSLVPAVVEWWRHRGEGATGNEHVDTPEELEARSRDQF